MSHPKFEIDTRLLADSHPLFEWRGCHLRLHKNACLPWLIIIPETHITEYTDLAVDEQLKINQLARFISDHCKQSLGCDKINFAAIGNVVKQLHVHVIGRHKNDPAWPDVIWGKALPPAEYDDKQIQTMASVLQKNIKEQL